jgi:hypothetical protein
MSFAEHDPEFYLKLFSGGWSRGVGGLLGILISGVEVDVIVVVITTWADISVR